MSLFPTSSALPDLGLDLPKAVGRRLYLGDVFSAMIMGNLVHTSSVVMRRARLAETGRFDEHLVTGEDYEFFLRATRAGPVAFADISDTRYRVGTTDRLSGRAMGLAIAESYMRTLEKTLANDADRIGLPPSLIDQARSFAYGWVGEQHLYAGSNRIARAYLASAVRIRPRPRLVALLGLTFVPRTIVRRLVDWRRLMAKEAAA